MNFAMNTASALPHLLVHVSVCARLLACMFTIACATVSTLHCPLGIQRPLMVRNHALSGALLYQGTEDTPVCVIAGHRRCARTTTCILDDAHSPVNAEIQSEHQKTKEEGNRGLSVSKPTRPAVDATKIPKKLHLPARKTR